MFKGSTLGSIVGILVITSTYAPSLNAQCSIVSEGALDAPTFQPGAKLDTVAVQGNIATVTSRQADSVSVFKLEGGTWTFDAELTPSGGSFGYFGDAVAIGNDVILVGTPNDAVSRGAAYVFRRINDAWVETQKLEASEDYFFDGFGISIAIDGDTAVIGDSGMGSQAGTAYIFKDIAGTWTEVEKLNSATNTSQNLGFGTTVAIDGDTVVVGGPASGYDGLVAVFRNFGGM